MKTKKYVIPRVNVVTADLKSHFLDMSIPIGTGPGPGGGGDTRQGNFDADTESDSRSNLWG